MGKRHREGFTLIELMVVVAVMGIALTVGVPAVSNLIASDHMATAVNDVVSSLYLARSEALKSRASVTLCASGTWSANPPDCDNSSGLLRGWVIFRDDNANGTIDAGEPILARHEPLADSIMNRPRSMADSWTPQYVSFGSDGRRQDLAGLPPSVQNLQLCDSRGNRDMGGGLAAGRWISISMLGRTSVAQTVAQVQGPGNPLGGC